MSSNAEGNRTTEVTAEQLRLIKCPERSWVGFGPGKLAVEMPADKKRVMATPLVNNPGILYTEGQKPGENSGVPGSVHPGNQSFPNPMPYTPETLAKRAGTCLQIVDMFAAKKVQDTYPKATTGTAQDVRQYRGVENSFNAAEKRKGKMQAHQVRQTEQQFGGPRGSLQNPSNLEDF